MRLFGFSTTRGPGLLVLLLVMGLILGACTQDDPAIEGSPPVDDQAAETDDGEDEHDDGEDEHLDFGEPGDPAAADRTIEIDMLDTLSFEPDSVDVQVGETITFVLTNTGEIEHDFVIGDEEYQQEHADEAAGMEHGDLPNGIDASPGETVEFTWTFTEEGELLYGCHEPGHYLGGMVGTINVTS